MGERKETSWCTLCGARFTDAETDGHSCCPKCGDKGVPCDASQDLKIEINWHELRILGIWAENYAHSCDAKDSTSNLSKTVGAITRRLQRQFPELTPLTLSQEISELPRKMQEAGVKIGSIESNVPKPDLIPINGPGAVQSTPKG